MAPATPHITAELWQRRRLAGPVADRCEHIHRAHGPSPIRRCWSPTSMTMIVQVNGKVRDRIEVDPAITEDDGRRRGAGVAEDRRAARRSRAPEGHRPAAEAREHRGLTSGAIESGRSVVPCRTPSPSRIEIARPARTERSRSSTGDDHETITLGPSSTTTPASFAVGPAGAGRVEPATTSRSLGPTTRDLVTAIQAVWLAGGVLVMLPLPMRMGSLDQFIRQTRDRIALRRRVDSS